MANTEKYRCRLIRHDDSACALAEPFWRMQDEGLADIIMYDAVTPNIADWHSVTNPKTALLICVEDVQSGEVVGVSWVNSFMGRCAMIHFCVFKVGHADAVAIGQTLLGFVFKHGKIDALMGLTPSVYRHALSYAKALGFQRSMVLPKACHLAQRKRYVDGIVTLLKREDFLKGGV